MSEATIDKDGIREHYGDVLPRAIGKELTYLDRHARAFIALSPFVVIASSNARGQGDATPRGDAPGFVAVPDAHTLVLPDRPGNRRVDTMMNVAENPHVGLLFMVPGFDETLRVNGTARISFEPADLQPLAVRGKAPVAALVVEVEEVYFHCGKALIRSNLWAPEVQVERSSFPSYGSILADQIAGADRVEFETAIADGYSNKLY